VRSVGRDQSRSRRRITHSYKHTVRATFCTLDADSPSAAGSADKPHPLNGMVRAGKTVTSPASVSTLPPQKKSIGSAAAESRCVVGAFGQRPRVADPGRSALEARPGPAAVRFERNDCRLCESGERTVLLGNHLLDDVERVADRVAVTVDGELLVVRRWMIFATASPPGVLGDLKTRRSCIPGLSFTVARSLALAHHGRRSRLEKPPPPSNGSTPFRSSTAELISRTAGYWHICPLASVIRSIYRSRIAGC